MPGAGTLRRLVHATLLALTAVGLAAGPAYSSSAGLFGTAEFRSDSLDALPQWQRVLGRIAAEEPAVRACARNPARCPNRATMAWLALLRGLEGAPAQEQIREVNRFVNQWTYRSDSENYGRSDYWATPLEFFRRSGDCEDYVIAKYRSLRRLGLPAERLRMVVVQDLVRDLPHAVLAVYLGDEVYILDNLSPAVLRQEQVGNYVPYYSVNESARWAHTPPDAVVVTSGMIAAVQPARP
jgi:predicted transglutaminase-like cysteine proteinase